MNNEIYALAIGGNVTRAELPKQLAEPKPFQYPMQDIVIALYQCALFWTLSISAKS